MVQPDFWVMTIPDPMAAVITHLLAQPEVSSLAGTRVFGEEIPRDKLADIKLGDQARQTVVLRRAGRLPSAGDNSRIAISRPRFDVFSYGESPHRASAVDLAVYETLKQMEPTTVGTCRLYDTVLLAGPITMREPDTQWPVVWRSYGVTVAETAVP